MAGMAPYRTCTCIQGQGAKDQFPLEAGPVTGLRTRRDAETLHTTTALQQVRNQDGPRSWPLSWRYEAPGTGLPAGPLLRSTDGFLDERR
ncbi:uncharacterized protein TrAtP1_003974 [Trichoderma atroviride]|uniref:uncharacterized protein n=1 Tax=Hypocrea atroviridis TaxID=63577 RepID=UPI003316D25F|nr:hypothetical protein TrAtP1_003974 [Trichoderma atroviride]